MKKRHFKILFVYTLLFITIKGIGQDSLDNYNLVRKHKYLDVNFKKENRLIKLAISPLHFFSPEKDFNIKSFSGAIAFEKKIDTSFSIILTNRARYRSNYTTYIGWEYTADLELRYYYTINRRIRESVGANNFHGNYFAVGLYGITKYSSLNDPYTVAWPVGYQHTGLKEWTFSPLIGVSWGIHRRIENWGFFDIGPFFKFKTDRHEIGINFLLGFGFS